MARESRPGMEFKGREPVYVISTSKSRAGARGMECRKENHVEALTNLTRWQREKMWKNISKLFQRIHPRHNKNKTPVGSKESGKLLSSHLSAKDSGASSYSSSARLSYF